MLPSRPSLPGLASVPHSQQQHALPESNDSSPDCTAKPPSPGADSQGTPVDPAGTNGSVMPGKGFTPGALPESGAGLGVSQVSAGPLRAPIPGSIPVVNKDAEQQKQDQQDEEGRSQRGSTGGSENDGEAGYGTAQASMPRNFRISLEGYSLQKDDDGTFAAYRINVTAGLHTWHVLRRWVCCVAFIFTIQFSHGGCGLPVASLHTGTGMHAPHASSTPSVSCRFFFRAVWERLCGTGQLAGSPHTTT